MSEFKKKESYKLWHSPLALVVLFCIFVLFLYNMVGLIRKERETSRNKAAELNKIEELRSREAVLSSDIQKLNTPEGVEASVRDKFQVVKPGEKEVLIVEEEHPLAQDDIERDHTFWGYIKRLFSK